jgi:histidyl-tRNA synthetase
MSDQPDNKKQKKIKKKKPQRVKPQLLKGFRDYPPEQQRARELMLGKMRQAVELMGFQPLQTASLESAAVLLGSHYNEDSLAELFGFGGPDEVDMALRYEFTLSLARYVAAQPNLPLPFRRYQYGNVWRVDKPGPGRFREFMQFDLDIVGTKNMLADAEIIGAMVSTMDGLGIERFKVRYSNRKILNGVIEWAGIGSERGPDVMRVLDKFEKQGSQAVIDELGGGRIDDSGAKIAGLNLPVEQISKVERFISEALSSGAASIDWVKDNLGDLAIAVEGMTELEEIQSHLGALGVEPSRAEVDLTIVRGLGYYTGPVFETTLLDLPEFGSVFSGGRYDNLLDRFQSQSVPAVGTSMGVDRLLAALLQLNAIELEQSTSKVLVTVMDRDRLPDYLSMLAELRQAGIASEIFTGDTKNLTRQVKYGDKVGIPLAVISGSNEFEAGEVTIKNMAAGAQKATATADREQWLKAEGFQQTVKRSEMVAHILQLLNGN